jgi:hypothetical protein
MFVLELAFLQIGLIFLPPFKIKDITSNLTSWFEEVYLTHPSKWLFSLMESFKKSVNKNNFANFSNFFGKYR